MNYVQFLFANLIFGLVFVGLLVHFFEKRLSPCIIKSFKYGKYLYQKGWKNDFLEVPKRWFRHFYVLAIILSTMGSTLLVCRYFGFIKEVDPNLKQFFKFFGTNTGKVPAHLALLAMILFMLNCWRRFVETHFVSVFSDSKMHVIHYITGYVHYIGTVLAILCEAPGIASDDPIKFDPMGITLINIISTVIFLYAWKHQFICAVKVANLRKNKEGRIVNTKHHVPHGDYYDFVSSPLQFFEIVMYLCLQAILWKNETFLYVFVWVFINQIATGFLGHWWYKETFKDYPKNRKAVIPFIL